MAFAVELGAAPIRVLRRIRAAMYAFAIACSALAVVSGPLANAWLPIVVALLLFGTSMHLRRATLTEGRLCIDEDGVASWRAFAADAPPGQTVHVARWFVLGPIAWIGLRFAGERRARDLLLLRGDDDERWRKLRAWLLWHGRGHGVPAPPAASIR